MTVGITVNNGREAVVVTDSRVSGHGRQSDSVDKMGVFIRPDYWGVIFATGRADYIEGVIRHVDTFQGDDWPSLVRDVQKNYNDRAKKDLEAARENGKRKIAFEAEVYTESDKKEEFVRTQTIGLLNDVGRFRKCVIDPTVFVAVGFDKKSKRVYQHGFNWYESNEGDSAHHEIGSGADGANMYLSTKLQGLEPGKLERPELVFYGLNAYANATVNEGVGGTPKIACIGEQGCTVLPVRMTSLLANLSGAYLSEYNSGVLTIDSMRELFANIIGRRKADPHLLRKGTGLSRSGLENICIPFSSWQEAANRRYQNSGAA